MHWSLTSSPNAGCPIAGKESHSHTRYPPDVRGSGSGREKVRRKKGRGNRREWKRKGVSKRDSTDLNRSQKHKFFPFFSYFFPKNLTPPPLIVAGLSSLNIIRWCCDYLFRWSLFLWVRQKLSSAAWFECDYNHRFGMKGLITLNRYSGYILDKTARNFHFCFVPLWIFAWDY